MAGNPAKPGQVKGTGDFSCSIAFTGDPDQPITLDNCLISNVEPNGGGRVTGASTYTLIGTNSFECYVSKTGDPKSPFLPVNCLFFDFEFSGD